MSIPKGSYGYIKSQKKNHLIIGFLTLVAVLAIYLLGLFYGGEFERYFTVVAAILILPTALNLTRYIMYSRYKSGKSSVYDKLCNVSDDIEILSDLILVRGKITVFFEFIIISEKQIIGLCQTNQDIHIVKELLEAICTANGYHNTIKVFNDENNFCEYVKETVRSTLNHYNNTEMNRLVQTLKQNSI